MPTLYTNDIVEEVGFCRFSRPQNAIKSHSFSVNVCEESVVDNAPAV